MKKVLFLIHTLGIGGAEKILVNLANHLAERDYHVTVMTVIDTGAFKKDLSDKIQYKTMLHLPMKLSSKSNSGSLQGDYTKLKDILKKLYQLIWRSCNAQYFYQYFIREKYDFEISFLEGICAKIISNSTNTQSKKYAWIHIDLINEAKSDRFFRSMDEERGCYGKFDKVVCVSDYVKKQAVKKLDLPEGHFVTLYNLIDKNEIQRKARKEIEETFDGFTFCAVGRLAPQKGYDRLIDVAKKLVRAGYGFSIFIVGEGPDYNSLAKRIKEYGLEQCVKLIGYRANPYPYMKKCTVFICPSRAEGFSTVASEAIVLGKPCLVTDCSGMSELFGAGSEYGLIVENSEEGIYDGMKKFLDDPSLAVMYGRKSLENTKRFDTETTIDAVEKNLLT